MRVSNIIQGIKWRLIIAADRFKTEAKGVAAVEFAFIAPIMLLLFVGTIELSAGVSVNRKLSRLSSTISDLVTQSQSLTGNDIDNIMDVAANVMYPYEDEVTMVISGVEIKNGEAKVTTSCSEPTGSALAAGTPYDVPTKIRRDGTFLIAAKVTTTYKPSFGWAEYSAAEGVSFDKTAIPMEEEIFLRPRIGSTVTFSC